jgi:hypothetical protein
MAAGHAAETDHEQENKRASGLHGEERKGTEQKVKAWNKPTIFLLHWATASGNANREKAEGERWCTEEAREEKGWMLLIRRRRETNKWTTNGWD